jgi:hypothetical protein
MRAWCVSQPTRERGAGGKDLWTRTARRAAGSCRARRRGLAKAIGDGCRHSHRVRPREGTVGNTLAHQPKLLIQLLVPRPPLWLRLRC